MIKEIVVFLLTISTMWKISRQKIIKKSSSTMTHEIMDAVLIAHFSGNYDTMQNIIIIPMYNNCIDSDPSNAMNYM